MVNQRRPRPKRTTISLPNPVVGKLMSPAARSTVAISTISAYSFRNMSRPGRAFARLRILRWFPVAVMASSQPSEVPPPPHSIPLPSSNHEEVPLLSSSPQDAPPSASSSTGGARILRQAVSGTGSNNTVDEEGAYSPEDTPLHGTSLASSEYLEDENEPGHVDIPMPSPLLSQRRPSVATSFASTGSDGSVATIMAQGTILPDNQAVEEEGEVVDEQGESSTAVVDRSNDPRFRTPEGYLGLPSSEIVEGPGNVYFMHPFHKTMKQTTNLGNFMFNATRLPANELNKAAAEVFPWKHIEKVRAPVVHDNKLLEYDDSRRQYVEQPCDDISKLDKEKLFGFGHEIDGWLKAGDEDARLYAKPLNDNRAKMDAINARVRELLEDNKKIEKALVEWVERLRGYVGRSALIEKQRTTARDEIYRLKGCLARNNAELDQLAQKYKEGIELYNEIVKQSRRMHTLDREDYIRAEAKRKAEAIKAEEEARHQFDLIKLGSQKKFERMEKEQALHRSLKEQARASKTQHKGKARAEDDNEVEAAREPNNNFPNVTTQNQADEANYLLADEDIYGASSTTHSRPSAQQKGKGKVTTTGTTTTGPNSASTSSGPSTVDGSLVSTPDVTSPIPLSGYANRNASTSSSPALNPNRYISPFDFSSSDSSPMSSSPIHGAGVDLNFSSDEEDAHPQRPLLPQTLAEANDLLTNAYTPPQSVPRYWPILDAQQLLALRSTTPRARFDEFMGKFAALYSQAEAEKKAATFGAAAAADAAFGGRAYGPGMPPKPEHLMTKGTEKGIAPVWHDKSNGWASEHHRMHGGWWLCPEGAPCKRCKEAREEDARAAAAVAARRGVVPGPEQQEVRQSAVELYEEINAAIDAAMAQAHEEEARELRERMRGEDEKKDEEKKDRGLN